MNEEPDESDRGLKFLLAGVLLIAVIGGAIDLALDAPDSLVSAHVIYEVILIVVSITALVFMWRGWFRARHDVIENARRNCRTQSGARCVEGQRGERARGFG
jgi:O-antigen/teichoic acid export membrane protein